MCEWVRSWAAPKEREKAPKKEWDLEPTKESLGAVWADASVAMLSAAESEWVMA